MSYTPFLPAGTNPAVDSPAVGLGKINANMLALRDAVVMGSFAGYNCAASGGTATQPATITYSKGTEVIKCALTWNTAGNVATAVWSYSADTGTTFVPIGGATGTQTVNYDANNNFTGYTWS